ncbi:MAG: GNAT family N-acetyltransferase [Planctomycetota bacterium]
MNATVIETERLELRRAGVEDAEAVARLWADPDLMKYMGGPRDREKVRQMVREKAAHSSGDPVAIWCTTERTTGNVIGDCGLLRKEIEGTPETEVFYLIAKHRHGKGFATEAAIALRDYAFNKLGLSRLVALIDPKNLASVRVAEKAGFSHERDVVRPSGKTMALFSAKKKRARK